MRQCKHCTTVKICLAFIAFVKTFPLSTVDSLQPWKRFWVWPAEGVYDQEVAHDAGNADGEDDGADGVVGVVRHVHRGEGMRGRRHHRHLEDDTGTWKKPWKPPKQFKLAPAEEKNKTKQSSSAL